MCAKDPKCVAWTSVETPDPTDGPHAVNCWPFSSVSGTVKNSNRAFGRCRADGGSRITTAIVTSRTGAVLFDGSAPSKYTDVSPNELHWPSPFCKNNANGTKPAGSYVFTDRPRFSAPAWGPTPIPKDAKVPAHLVSTNGADMLLLVLLVLVLVLLFLLLLLLLLLLHLLLLLSPPPPPPPLTSHLSAKATTLRTTWTATATSSSQARAARYSTGT